LIIRLKNTTAYDLRYSLVYGILYDNHKKTYIKYFTHHQHLFIVYFTITPSDEIVDSSAYTTASRSSSTVVVQCSCL